MSQEDLVRNVRREHDAMAHWNTGAAACRVKPDIPPAPPFRPSDLRQFALALLLAVDAGG